MVERASTGVELDGEEPQGEAIVELSSRLVYSLLKAAVRVAAGFGMPLQRLTQLAQTAYFEELRRTNPRDLQAVADQLGVSVRTAGTIHRRLKGAFFAPENEVAPLRAVTGALLSGARTQAELATATDLDDDALRRALRLLGEHGWVEREGPRFRVATGIRSFVTDETMRRVDGLNNQMDVLAGSVWARFVDPKPGAGARTWVFAARPQDFEQLMADTVHRMRHDAVDLEERALPGPGWVRFGVTVAFAPVLEES